MCHFGTCKLFEKKRRSKTEPLLLWLSWADLFFYIFAFITFYQLLLVVLEFKLIVFHQSNLLAHPAGFWCEEPAVHLPSLRLSAAYLHQCTSWLPSGCVDIYMGQRGERTSGTLSGRTPCQRCFPPFLVQKYFSPLSFPCHLSSSTFSVLSFLHLFPQDLFVSLQSADTLLPYVCSQPSHFICCVKL